MLRGKVNRSLQKNFRTEMSQQKSRASGRSIQPMNQFPRSTPPAGGSAVL